MAVSRNLLKLNHKNLEKIGALLREASTPLINQLLEIVERYGGPEQINRKAKEACKLENLART